MSNLQSIIANTKFELKKQENQIELQLNTLKKYVQCVLDVKKQNEELNEKEFTSNVNQLLNQTQNTLKSLNNKLKTEKNLESINQKIIDAVYPISSMITSIKSVSSAIILAQNKCALNGDFESADKLAKISLELNYENHMFVKKASEEIKTLKQNLNI